MKLELFTQNKRRLNFPIPLSLLSSLNIITVKPCGENDTGIKIVKICAKLLKDYKRQYGSFTIVEVEEENGIHIKITV